MSDCILSTTHGSVSKRSVLCLLGVGVGGRGGGHEATLPCEAATPRAPELVGLSDVCTLGRCSRLARSALLKWVFKDKGETRQS